MKFKTSSKELKSTLSVIKSSTSLSNSDKGGDISEDWNLLKIVAHSESGKVDFFSTNIGVWSGSTLDAEVEESGEVFIDGPQFIKIIDTFDKESFLDFSAEKDKDKKETNLICKTKNPKNNKWIQKTGFLTVTSVGPFDENPPDEKREKITVSADELIKAVNAVEFSSDTNIIRQYLWGVQVEIFGKDDIAACATDKIRICWYDKKGADRDTEKAIIFIPIKSSFVSALKSINPKEDVDLEIGNKYTIIRQNEKWHGVPNTVQTDTDKMPVWREIAKKLEQDLKTFFKISKKELEDCVRSALVSPCGKFGVKIGLSSKKKMIKLAIDSIEDGGIIKTSVEAGGKLDDDKISGEEIEGKFTLTIESLRDILSRCKSDEISIKIKDLNSPVIILDENEDFQYISSVVV